VVPRIERARRTEAVALARAAFVRKALDEAVLSREEIVTRLAKGIEVDGYGECGGLYEKGQIYGVLEHEIRQWRHRTGKRAYRPMNHQHNCKGCQQPIACPESGSDPAKCKPVQRNGLVCERCSGADRAERKEERRKKMTHDFKGERRKSMDADVKAIAKDAHDLTITAGQMLQARRDSDTAFQLWHTKQNAIGEKHPDAVALYDHFQAELTRARLAEESWILRLVNEGRLPFYVAGDHVMAQGSGAVWREGWIVNTWSEEGRFGFTVRYAGENENLQALLGFSGYRSLCPFDIFDPRADLNGTPQPYTLARGYEFPPGKEPAQWTLASFSSASPAASPAPSSTSSATTSAATTTTSETSFVPYAGFPSDDHFGPVSDDAALLAVMPGDKIQFTGISGLVFDGKVRALDSDVGPGYVIITEARSGQTVHVHRSRMSFAADADVMPMNPPVDLVAAVGRPAPEDDDAEEAAFSF
jgi:hypothetical protein